MAQLGTKFGYLKSGKSRGGYAKYIATREGVEKLDESLRERPVTQSQQEFIQKMLEDFPDSKDLLEYEDYQKSPTLGSASEFISQAIELHMGELSGRSGYLKYMGTRPRVEKEGSHGLFSYTGEPISLNKVAQEVDALRGNIWTAIYSLRREDAQRLGYDTAARWRDLLRSQAITLADGLKIPPTHLKWYAAFHNEGHHPHVHLIAYERDTRHDNYPFAAYALGCLYLRGQGVERDEEYALELFLTAAEKGNPYAQYLLGKIYYWGNGVEQDREKGLEYIQLAAEQGHPGAVRFLERLAQGEQDAYTASLFPMATRLLRQVGQIFRQQFQIDPPVARLVDAKLRRKIAEKKLAHGQKIEM